MPLVIPIFGIITCGARDAILALHGHDLPDRVRSSELKAAQLDREALDLIDAHPSGAHDHVVFVVHLFLFRCTSAYGLTQGLWVYGCSSRPSSHQRYVVVATRALAIQFSNDTSAAAHESGRFLHQSLLASFVVNVSLHQESAHVRLGNLYRGMV